MFRNFFRGCYGVDTLSLVLLVFALIFVRIWYLWIISVAIVAFIV